MQVQSHDSNLMFDARSETVMSVALLLVLVVLLVPLPSALLDMLLATNVAITILLLLVTLRVTHAMELSVFPSLLLLLTIFRLSLNVATTRLILLNGDAGRIVATFGSFVVGGSLVVGLVIFLILIIIQFIVITKGSSRVSEVSARFMLDALPGKQMAIDAELTSGAIDEPTARQRRQELTRETEFYGAMDGASKFVRGDAIASLIVTAINLIGGIALGMSRGMAVSEAVGRFSVLTIGDGLVTQIPALIIATAAGMLVTKAGSRVSIGVEIGTQFTRSPSALATGAVIVGCLAFVPGLPMLAFLTVGSGLAGLLLMQRSRQRRQMTPESKPESQPPKPEEMIFGEFLRTDSATLEIGAELFSLVGSPQSPKLAGRIAQLRKDLTEQHGIWIPLVRLVDNLQLRDQEYRICVGGRAVAGGSVRPRMSLAIDPPDVRLQIEGERVTEPTFGMPARWIEESQCDRAKLAGYTVVDAISVIITHLGETLREHAADLLSREDLKRLLDELRVTHPTIVEELKADPLRLGKFHTVLRLLLEDCIPISDLARIVESFLRHQGQQTDFELVADMIRHDLGRAVCDRYRDRDGLVSVILVDPALEMDLRQAIHEKDIALTAPQLARLVERLKQLQQRADAEGLVCAVACHRHLRRPLRRAIRRSLRNLQTLALSEIPYDLLIHQIGMLKRADVFATNENTAGDSLELSRQSLGLAAA